ncbi:EAL domain-containing protein [Catellatospora coxensis]
MPAVQDDEFSRILADRAVTPVFQPIVSLDDGLTVGFEALIRGPEGSRFSTPDALFAEAERRGAVVELDWICAGAACTAALDAGLDVPLFLNVEPDTFGSTPPPELTDGFARAAGRLDLVFEVTERVVRDPATLIRSVVGARRARSRIALDRIPPLAHGFGHPGA